MQCLWNQSGPSIWNRQCLQLLMYCLHFRSCLVLNFFTLSLYTIIKQNNGNPESAMNQQSSALNYNLSVILYSLKSILMNYNFFNSLLLQRQSTKLQRKQSKQAERIYIFSCFKNIIIQYPFDLSFSVLFAKQQEEQRRSDLFFFRRILII